MQLLSVNTSRAKTVEYQHKTIATGIFKQPVEGPVYVSPLNLDGDEQVDLTNHGGGHKAVYAFSSNEYSYWQHTLGLTEPLPYGTFGENLTIHELHESGLCIGDHLQINDCILEITQPRVPCFKLGMVFRDSHFPKRFIEHGATGIYFKVISPGTIQAGDIVRCIHRDPAQLSVQTLFQAYFASDFPNANEIIAKASGIAALSDEWREKVCARLESKSQSAP